MQSRTFEAPKWILAKSPKDKNNIQNGEKLSGHSSYVLEASRNLFGSYEEPSRLATKWIDFFRLDRSKLKSFFVNSEISMILHDIGKANSGFVGSIMGEKGNQTIRHEHLSGLILGLPEIRNWIGTIPEADHEIILSAVICHHLKAGESDFCKLQNPDITLFRVFGDNLSEILDIVSEKLGLQSVVPQIPSIWSFEKRKGDFFYFEPLKEQLRKSLKKVGKDKERLSLLIAVRAALIVSDSAGSGLFRERKDLSEWIKNAFDESALIDSAYIENSIVNPRKEDLEKKGVIFKWNDFQDSSESIPSRSLLLAPCGSGKTLAAWRWIKGQLKEKSVSRVIFLYPTRGTASEGFRDYVSWAPEADAALVHGAASYELNGMFSNGDERSGKDFSTEDRLFALGFWQRRIFSATFDQFFGFMQYSYRSLCLLPMLADSVIVVDEVHSFDKSMFSVLKSFLKAFEVPVLCMTASLPPRRIEELRNCGLHVFPEDINKFSDLASTAEMPRYFVKSLSGADEARIVAMNSFNSGKKVLWVVNTVKRCQSLAKELIAVCYHSRFKLEDRRNKHEHVITMFQQNANAAIAVTTQVCEMSLDLDADVLITESAPIPSLIQRMGRCNRRAKPGGGKDKLGEVFIYTPADRKPYSDEDLKRSESFVRALDNMEASQARLQELLEELGPSDVEVIKYAAFLESGAFAKSGEEDIRDSTDFTVQAVLDSDISEFMSLKKSRKPVAGFLIPVPKNKAFKDSRLGSWPLAADSSHYSSDLGFLDEREGA